MCEFECKLCNLENYTYVHALKGCKWWDYDVQASASP